MRLCVCELCLLLCMCELRLSACECMFVCVRMHVFVCVRMHVFVCVRIVFVCVVLVCVQIAFVLHAFVCVPVVFGFGWLTHFPPLSPSLPLSVDLVPHRNHGSQDGTLWVLLG